MLAISVPAFIFADSWGRRTSVITGGIGLSSCMFIIGSLYATDSVHAHSGSGRWFVIMLVFVFALTYCSTWAIVGKIYASEIQPVQTRAAANSVAQGLGFVSHMENPTNLQANPRSSQTGSWLLLLPFSSHTPRLAHTSFSVDCLFSRSSYSRSSCPKLEDEGWKRSRTGSAGQQPTQLDSVVRCWRA